MRWLVKRGRLYIGIIVLCLTAVLVFVQVRNTMAATTALDVTMKVVIAATLVADGDLSDAEDALNFTQTQMLTNGTTSNKSDLIWSSRRTLAATTSEDLDLNGSLVQSVGGGTFDAVEITAIAIKNRNIVAGDKLEVGGAVANQWVGWLKDATDIIIVGPSAVEFGCNPIDGWAVVAATGDLLKINNPGANTITYDIVVIGRSA
jgi:hypothetical protein